MLSIYCSFVLINYKNKKKIRFSIFAFQGGESIDFTWSRYKVNKKILKIKSAELEDTGVYGCKGINGFGSDAVRLELIIVGTAYSVDIVQDLSCEYYFKVLKVLAYKSRNFGQNLTKILSIRLIPGSKNTVIEIDQNMFKCRIKVHR